MEVPVFYGLSKCQSGQEWWMLRRSITIELLWCIWNGLYGNPKKVAINLANDSAIVIVLWLTNKALWYKIDPEFTLLRWRLELEHYPALVTLLAHGEAETRNLRLVLWGYDWKVEWTQQPKLLRVCAHQRKVGGSNLQMCIFLEALRVYFFLNRRKSCSTDCRCVYMMCSYEANAVGEIYVVVTRA